MIEFRRVSKSFNKKSVLIDFSMILPEGKTFALLGLSGSGKTTALKLICGLHSPDQGEVLVNGLEASKSSLHSIRDQIGYVIQDGGLFPHLRARENLSLVGQEAGWSSKQIQSRIEELASLTRFSMDLLTQYPKELSGGQRQRVGLMRALMKNPPILLLDEPLGALDPITRHELQTELKQLFKELKKTCLLVTHDLYEAGTLADQILLLNQGRILQQGRLKDLIDHPADSFVSQFVQSQRQVGAEE